ncbi:MAG: aminopeptidase [Desulfobacterota bacterium]|nr:aminopeptidase [Thermodesulfobacteriota bacterium]
MEQPQLLSEQQLDRYASVLIWGMQKARAKKFKKNDIVIVRFDLPAIRLAEVVQGKLLDMGIHPILRMVGTSAMERTFFVKANQAQLVFEAPGERVLYRSLNGSIYLHAPQSLTHLQDIDPARIAAVARARKPLRDIMFKREEQGHLGWTLCTYPTPAMAQHARLSLKTYTAQVIKACYLDASDPVRAWEDIYQSAHEIKRWLNSLKIKTYHIVAKDIDLHITHGERRRWIGISGHNIPSFELFISPDWRGTEGVYYADQPSFRSGNLVRGVRLTFRKGGVVSAEAEQGAAFVHKQLAMDPGARRIGEFSLTDVRFSKIDRFMADTLYDENYGGRYGNCHVALGSSYSDTYDGNTAQLTTRRKEQLGFNDSALHWDLVNTQDKTVIATLRSGKHIVLYEHGKFAY